MIEGQHYQNAYITRDIDRAIAQFGQQIGRTDIQSFEANVEVWTPRGSGSMSTRMTLFWINNLQYEIIQPVSGRVDVYANALPPDDSLLFHHICMRVDDWDVFRQKVREKNWPVVLEGGDEHLKFLYLDARKVVGHYLEYTWMTEERWKVLGNL